MGCSEGRTEGTSEFTDDLTKLESLPIFSEQADKVIRKFAPFPYITPPQLERILGHLNLLPLQPAREAFYLTMARPEGFIKLHFLVAAIMQGKGSPEAKLQLLFETLDEHYEGIVSRDMVKTLLEAMVYVAFVYPGKMLPKNSKLRLPSSQLELNRISLLLMEKIAVGVSVASHDLTNLAMQENWRDIGTPTGLRRLVSVVPAKKVEPVALNPPPEEAKEAEKRYRKRKKTERGEKTSEFIRQRTLAIESAAFASPAKARTPNPQLSPRFFAPSPVS